MSAQARVIGETAMAQRGPIKFWAEVQEENIYLYAEHEAHARSQVVAVLLQPGGGTMMVAPVALFCADLCQAFGISEGSALPVLAENPA